MRVLCFALCLASVCLAFEALAVESGAQGVAVEVKTVAQPVAAPTNTASLELKLEDKIKELGRLTEHVRATLEAQWTHISRFDWFLGLIGLVLAVLGFFGITAIKSVTAETTRETISDKTAELIDDLKKQIHAESAQVMENQKQQFQEERRLFHKETEKTVTEAARKIENQANTHINDTIKLVREESRSSINEIQELVRKKSQEVINHEQLEREKHRNMQDIISELSAAQRKKQLLQDEELQLIDSVANAELTLEHYRLQVNALPKEQVRTERVINVVREWENKKSELLETTRTQLAQVENIITTLQQKRNEAAHWLPPEDTKTQTPPPAPDSPPENHTAA